MASVRERVTKSGERTWAVLYRHGSKQTSRTFSSAKAAEKFRAVVDSLGPEKALELLANPDVGPVGPSLDALFADWLAWKRTRADVLPRTADDYERDWQNWISPWLGHREAQAVGEGDVQEWIDRIAQRLSPKTVAGHHALLHSVYSWAASAKRRLVPHNPCKETELPRKSKDVVRGLRMPEWHRLHAAMERIDPDAADFILFLASTGWRFSEAVALPAWAVEDDGQAVYVTLSQVARRKAGIVADAKSQAAFRRVRLFGAAVPMIRRRLIGKGPNDLVFTTARGSRWHAGPFRERKWLPAVEAADLAHRSPTPHWLRHTHVALCVAAGMSLPEIQRRIGHESITTTINVYGRMIDEISSEVADKMEAIFTSEPVAIGSVVSESASEEVLLGRVE